MKDKPQRLVKFGAVGASGVGVNLALLYFFTDVAGLHYAASALIAIEASIISNFLLNDRWTFKDRRDSKIWSRLLKFNTVSAAGIGVNMGIMALLVEVGGLHYLIAEFMAIMCAFIWNYTLSSRYVWRGRYASVYRGETKAVS
jgi:dolichol-phosphate mannosyltransferase